MPFSAFLTAADYAQRRQQFAAQLLPNSITLLSAADEIIRTGDSHFPFRQDSDFHYLTGFPEPEAMLVLLRDSPQTRYILFSRARQAAEEIWTGTRAGQSGACEQYGADEAYPISEFLTRLPGLLQGRDILYFAFGRHRSWDRKILHTLNTLRQQARRGIPIPETLINPETILHEMRLHKSATEIAVMREAAQITVQAHQRAMQRCRPGLYEYELQAIISETFIQHNGQHYAYYPIVASGANSCVLHYQHNNRQIQNEDMVLIDAGVERENYAADVTRTFPANGQFTAEQRALYEIVLQAQLAVIDCIKPGLPFNILQETAVKIIAEGLHALGLLTGSIENILAEKTYLPFYMHGVSHWLGLDTHDAGNYKIGGAWRSLAEGMVLTVEPGIYIAPHTPNVPERWWGIGIRIEDDVQVTAEGSEVLSAGLAKTVEEIEQLMG